MKSILGRWTYLLGLNWLRWQEMVLRHASVLITPLIKSSNRQPDHDLLLIFKDDLLFRTSSDTFYLDLAPKKVCFISWWKLFPSCKIVTQHASRLSALNWLASLNSCVMWHFWRFSTFVPLSFNCLLYRTPLDHDCMYSNLIQRNYLVLTILLEQLHG